MPDASTMGRGRGENRPATETILSCQDLDYVENGRHLFQGVTFELKLGQGGLLWADHHRSPRALLKVCASLERPHEGRLSWMGAGPEAYADDRRALGLKHLIGLVHRETRLVSNFTVMQNMTLGLEYNRGLSWGEARARVDGLLEKFDLYKTRDLRPEDLNYEKLRMALYVRELVKDPKLILFEMPLMDLGDDRHRQLLEEIWGRAERKECAFLISAVPPGAGREWVDWIMIMQRQGSELWPADQWPGGPD